MLAKYLCLLFVSVSLVNDYNVMADLGLKQQCLARAMLAGFAKAL